MSDYPTDEQILEHLEAYKKGGTALEDLLAKKDREAAAQAEVKPTKGRK